MNSIVKSTFILTFVCLIAAALLGTAYTLTEEKIEEQKSIALKSNLKQVFPAADDFKATNDHYVALQDGKTLGVAAVVETTGYGGKIKILVGMDTDKKITGIRIMEQEETPGLGANAVKKDFYSQFDGLTSIEVALKKDSGKIDSITGATITSQAVIDGVKAALTEKLEKLQND